MASVARNRRGLWMGNGITRIVTPKRLWLISGGAFSTIHDGPLTPAVFHILLALAGGDRHGCGIRQEVASETGNAFTMGPGTLYGTLKRLLAAGLVAESGERAEAAMSDERRRYYRLTPAGRRAGRHGGQTPGVAGERRQGQSSLRPQGSFKPVRRMGVPDGLSAGTFRKGVAGGKRTEGQ